MSNKEIENAKKEMKLYIDFFGGKLKDINLIDDAKTFEDLEYIFSTHYDFIGDMATDAQASLERFKRKIGVTENYLK